MRGGMPAMTARSIYDRSALVNELVEAKYTGQLN